MPADDVMQHCIEANSTQHGLVSYLTNGKTGFANRNPGDHGVKINAPTSGTVYARYNTRFDDPRYYQGDTDN